MEVGCVRESGVSVLRDRCSEVNKGCGAAASVSSDNRKPSPGKLPSEMLIYRLDGQVDLDFQRGKLCVFARLLDILPRNLFTSAERSA
jgi:hypothetical protein